MLASALQAQVQNIADEFNTKAVPQLFKYNNFRGIKELPKIVPGQINTPSLKEVALILRAMGTDISGDQKLMNYIRHIMGMPKLDNETFETVYAPQSKHDPVDNTPNMEEPGEGVSISEPVTPKPDDTVENDFEQNDLSYVGGNGDRG
jgi:hypothetical protein